MPAIVAVVMSMALVTPIRATQDGPVWFWFATCGGPNMTLEFRFDKATIEKVTMPLCRAPRSNASSQGQMGRIEFAFAPCRAMRWSGYRDKSDRTRAGQILEISVWQAGADPEALTIGVSVIVSDTVVMNTVHIAHSDRRDESTIAPGLTVATYPLSR